MRDSIVPVLSVEHLSPSAACIIDTCPQLFFFFNLCRSNVQFLEPCWDAMRDPAVIARRPNGAQEILNVPAASPYPRRSYVQYTSCGASSVDRLVLPGMHGAH